MMSAAVMPGRIVQPCDVDCQPSVYAKSFTKPCIGGDTWPAGPVAGGPVVPGTAVLPNSWSLVAMYPSPGSAPGMKYAFGVAGSILNTVTGLPLASGLDSVPASPS